MSGRNLSSFRFMVMTSVGGRAHRGPVTRSTRAGLGGPRTRIGAIRKTGVCWEGRNAVEDGGAVARTNQPEQDHHSGRGPRWVSADLLFSMVFRLQRRRHA